MKYTSTPEELRKIVEESFSIREVLLRLGLAAKGSNYKTMKNRIEKLSIDTSHFTGQGWRANRTISSTRKKLDEILIENSAYKTGNPRGSNKIKNILFRNNLKEKKCEICELSEWQGKELVFELHHVNGDSMDNRIENLQILCPNCHSQTDNFRGKNIKGSPQLTEVHRLENG